MISMSIFGHRLFVFLVLFSVVCPFECILVRGDDYADYVREVLEEDEGHYGEEYYQDDSTADDYYEKLRQQQEGAEKQRLSEEEQLVREQTDRIAAERERNFQAELARMDAVQQKAAMRQKKEDAKVVRSVLKAAKKNKHYAVLGLANWDLKIPSRAMNIAGFKFTIPGATLKQTSTKHIRKAYRTRAMSVHPDKNRDGRAQEAFIAVENAASILSDERLRAEYDEEERRYKQQRSHDSKAVVFKYVQSVQSVVGKLLKAIHTVLGPFATPVIIIGALLI